jgi:hypothetical protein
MPTPIPALAPDDNPESRLVWLIPLTSVPLGPVLIADGAVVALTQRSVLSDSAHTASLLQQPPPADGGQLYWLVVQPEGAIGTKVVGTVEVDTQPFVTQEYPSEQHPSPYELAHWYALNAEHGRGQQDVVTVAFPVSVNVVLHWY